MSQVCHFCMEGNFLKYQQSDFEKNLKNKGAIVYPATNGPTVFLTAEFFDSQDEFAFWKSVSDEDYRSREKDERREKTHTVSLDDVPEINAAAISAETEILLRAESAQQKTKVRSLLLDLKANLSATQLRRLGLHVISGLPVKEIAAIDHVTPLAVSKSLKQAKQRILTSGILTR